MRDVMRRGQQGFSMIAVLGVMLAGMLLAGAAVAAVGGDLPFARASEDRKQAYAAAEAGLEYYAYQLSRDTDAWTHCTDVPPPSPSEAAPVNQRWDGSGRDPRIWRALTGSDARYTVELLPANGAAACDPAHPEQTMLDSGTGTFSIRSTGSSRGIERTIVATFRRSSFLDYLYFTDLETSDPATYATASKRNWANGACVHPRAGRDPDCNEITFTDADAIRGPFHTNDDIRTCGSPDLGRTSRDRIEISGPAEDGYTAVCSGTPDFLGTPVHPAPTLTLPTTNAALETVAQPAYRFDGTTSIALDGTTMTVTSALTGTTTTMNLPPNGVIYVRNAGCSGTQTPLLQSYADGRGCAVLTLHGTYSRSLTIASAADIVLDGDLRRDGDVVLGLIANNFVRVAHPVSRSNPASATSCANAAGTMADVTIQAAILTLAHSFIVDNYACGARLGTLHVEGAIAQRFRGPVGTFDTATGQGRTGYTKDYAYDDRLRFRSPPSFLDPVSAAWRIIRSHEQVPAA